MKRLRFVIVKLSVFILLVGVILLPFQNCAPRDFNPTNPNATGASKTQCMAGEQPQSCVLSDSSQGSRSCQNGLWSQCLSVIGLDPNAKLGADANPTPGPNAPPLGPQLSVGKCSGVYLAIMEPKVGATPEKACSIGWITQSSSLYTASTALNTIVNTERGYTANQPEGESVFPMISNIKGSIDLSSDYCFKTWTCSCDPNKKLVTNNVRAIDPITALDSGWACEKISLAQQVAKGGHSADIAGTCGASTHMYKLKKYNFKYQGINYVLNGPLVCGVNLAGRSVPNHVRDPYDAVPIDSGGQIHNVVVVTENLLSGVAELPEAICATLDSKIKCIPANSLQPSQYEGRHETYRDMGWLWPATL